MEEVLLFLLKQSAVVVALGLGNWAQWKEKKELKDNLLSLVEAHEKEKKELNAIIQSNNNKNTEALTRISVTMETIKDNLKSE
jgi:hypothetical protein